MRITTLLDNVFCLFYPRTCFACGDPLPQCKEIVCTTCHYELPNTNFVNIPDNEFVKRLWGRVPIHHASAMYYFVKGGLTQSLIHQLKYNGQQKVGIKLGEWFGEMLKQSPYYTDIAGIIPVPLHPAKLRLRGYNQSAVFAEGIANTTQLACWDDVLMRTTFTESQTRKNVNQRIQNVSNVFSIKNANKISGKHILLVDDVMTTGATLEACITELLTVPQTQISVATIAMA